MGKNGKAKQEATNAHEKATLRWMKIDSFRHVEPCELRFCDTFNVLLGLNATGKTTLLELIASALKFNFSKLKNEPFSLQYEIAVPGGTIVASVRNDEPEPRPHTRTPKKPKATVAASLPEGKPSYRPSVNLRIRSAAGKEDVILRVDETGGEVEIEGRTSRYGASRANDVLHARFLDTLFWWVKSLNDPALEDAERIVAATIGSWRSIRRFDEALGFLRTVTGASTRISVEAHRIGGYHQYGLTGRGSVPARMVSEVGRQCRTWEGSAAAAISIDQRHVPLLARISSMLGMKRSELRLAHLGTDVTGAVEHWSYGLFRFMLERRDGSVIPHDLLSYGQKRTLAFLYYLDVNQETVIADELVDGLHHLWIKDSIEAIGARQAFLASQNPLLLDYLEFDSTSRVRSSFIQCQLRPSGNGQRMIWSNLSEYDSKRFFEAYQVGLQHVSEILRTKGLW